MTVLGDVLRTMFGKTGPRREALDQVNREVAVAASLARATMTRNRRAIDSLLKDVLDRVEHIDEPH